MVKDGVLASFRDGLGAGGGGSSASGGALELIPRAPSLAILSAISFSSIFACPGTQIRDVGVTRRSLSTDAFVSLMALRFVFGVHFPSVTLMV